MLNFLNKLNDWLGAKISFWLSTMTMFYLISVLIIIPLFFQRPDTLVGWMQYIISVFFQGAALPVLGYVARQVGDHQEKLIGETHEMVMAEFNNMQNENVTLKSIIADIHEQQHLQKKQNAELLIILKDFQKQEKMLHEQNKEFINLVSMVDRIEKLLSTKNDNQQIDIIKID